MFQYGQGWNPADGSRIFTFNDVDVHVNVTVERTISLADQAHPRFDVGEVLDDMIDEWDARTGDVTDRETVKEAYRRMSPSAE